MHRRFTAFAWFVLAFNLAVVLWGAYVRATGSGAGCGAHWPLCNGEVVPRAPGTAMMIEFTHRASSGVVLILVVLLAVWAFREFPAGHVVRKCAAWAVALMVVEALLGASLVLLGHVAGNASMNRAYSLSVHLVNTLFLIASLTMTAWWSQERERPVGVPVSARTGTVLRVTAGVFLVVGVLGAIAALGDTLFRSASLAQGMQQDLDPASHPFVRLRMLHPALAVALAGALIAIALYIVAGKRGSRYTGRFAYALVWLTLLQVMIGALNLALMAPVWLQMVHLLSADLLWITLVLLGMELRPAAARE